MTAATSVRGWNGLRSRLQRRQQHVERRQGGLHVRLPGGERTERAVDGADVLRVLVRPQEVMRFDDIEDPMMMDRVLRRAGMETVDWQFKTECCGAGHTLPHPDAVWKLGERILRQAKQAGAEALAVTCPLCQSNLDFQDVTRRRHHSDLTLPVLFFTQLLGLALGIPAADLMLNRLFTDPRPLLKQKGLAGVK